MPSYLTSIVLQWSADPLSDTTPTWTTVSNSEIRNIEWWAGIDREGNDPEPGGMTVTLKNVARKWEPLFSSNLIDTQQRFRLTLNGTQEGVWYTENFDIDYPSGQEFSWVTIGCGDGISVLALDDLPSLDPPEAESYEDVVGFDEPWGYWRLGDTAGTKAVAKFRTVFRGKGKRRRKIRRRIGTRYLTRNEAEGTSGPPGVYLNLPRLGQRSLILGDSDTSVEFVRADSQWVRAIIEENKAVGDGGSATGCKELSDQNALTVEAWVQQGTGGNIQTIVAGPGLSGGGIGIFTLAVSAADLFTWRLAWQGGGSTTLTGGASTGDVQHVVATWDGTTMFLHVDGVESSRDTPGRKLANAGNLVGDRPWIHIGRTADTAAGEYFNGLLDEVAIYEHALSLERIMAHHEAGHDRGFAQNAATGRIFELVDNPLWDALPLDTGLGREVVPVMMHGQARMEEVAESMHAEGPRTMFFFDGGGDPVYLGFDWQETSANYNTVQWTLTDDGTGKPYQDVQLEYDFETFNEVNASREGGTLVTAADATEDGKRGHRANSEYTDVLLAEQADVEALAAGVLDYYREPAKRPVSLTIDGSHCLAQILDLDIGHLIHVKKQGETGAATERVCHVIAKRKAIDTSKHLLCTYTLSRGFDPTVDGWFLGYDGYSELGETTVLA